MNSRKFSKFIYLKRKLVFCLLNLCVSHGVTKLVSKKATVVKTVCYN